jgi:hypothetical protein
MFLLAQNALKDELHTHLATGGRISLTTDTWSARNYRQFIAVTGHWIDTDWKLHSRTIDLLRLTEPIHSGDYLAEKLLEITNSMSITHGVFTITRQRKAKRRYVRRIQVSNILSLDYNTDSRAAIALYSKRRRCSLYWTHNQLSCSSSINTT